MGGLAGLITGLATIVAAMGAILWLFLESAWAVPGVVLSVGEELLGYYGARLAILLVRRWRAGAWAARGRQQGAGRDARLCRKHPMQSLPPGRALCATRG